MNFLDLDPQLRLALREDIGRGDITSEAILRGLTSGAPKRAVASVQAKTPLVVAGWPVFVRVFELLGDVVVLAAPREGEEVQRGVMGRLASDPFLLLRGERVALNLLQRLCGIATETAHLVSLISHTGARVLDTRKTTPLWRDLEKYAVEVGGGRNHRWRLDDGILIKDNHVAIAGGVRQAVEACREHSPHLNRIEVEVSTLDDLEEAIEAGADIVLLDNMSPAQVGQAVARNAGRCLLEVSGGISEETIVSYAETGVDFISVGRLTHSVRAADISLSISQE